MVPHVEGFSSELEVDAFIHSKLLEQTHVPVLESGLVDHITNLLGDERSVRGGSEVGSAADPLTGCSKRMGITQLAVPSPILTVDTAAIIRVESYAGVVLRLGRTTRRTTLELRDSTELPSSQNFPNYVGLATE